MNQIETVKDVLNSLPFDVLILKADSREVLFANKMGQKSGASVSKTCFRSWAKREKPCPFCLAPKVRNEGLQQLPNVEWEGGFREVFWSPLSDDLYLHFAFDVTEQKAAEKKHFDCLERYKNVFEKGPIGIVLVDKNFRMFEANPAFCRFIGYSQKEICEMNVLDITHPDYGQIERDMAVKLFKSEIAHHKIEKRFVTKSGGIIWAEVTGSIIRNVDGSVAYGLGITEDITERKLAETKRKKAEKKLWEKNITLRNILADIESEKDAIKEAVFYNVTHNIKPLFERLKDPDDVDKMPANYLKDIKAIEKLLDDICGDFRYKINRISVVLNPNEMRICQLVLYGYQLKEVAEIIHVSLNTIKSHIKKIRRKLGISQTKVRLSEYLNKLQ